MKDDSGILFLRFLNFYPSQQKQLAIGKRIRALGEARVGYFGMEMVHPKCRSAGENTPLKQALTPVYPTTAGLPQATLSKHIRSALNDVELPDTLPAELIARLKLPGFADSVKLLHNPTPDIDAEALLNRAHPAWYRIKFDELLAQQLSMRLHYRKSAQLSAPFAVMHAHGKLLRQQFVELDAHPGGMRAFQQRILVDVAAADCAAASRCRQSRAVAAVRSIQQAACRAVPPRSARLRMCLLSVACGRPAVVG